jgi:hypothetical protein
LKLFTAVGCHEKLSGFGIILNLSLSYVCLNIFIMVRLAFFFLLQELRNFRLEVEVPSKHHTKLIGRRGAVVNKIRADHDVQIIFPDKDRDRQDTITIIGLEEKALKAREDILQKVQELVSVDMM